jgi:hypothetical protein
MKTDPISAAVLYRQHLDMIMKAQVLSQAKQIARRALAVVFDRPASGTISIMSGFGHNTGQAFVTISMANPQEVASPTIQIATHQARRIAFQILEAADAAESDGFLVAWLRGSADLSDGQLGSMLQMFRDWREQQRQRQEGENT